MDRVTKQKVIAELLKSGHHDLANRVSRLSIATEEDDFYREDYEQQYKFDLANLTDNMTKAAKLIAKVVKGKIKEVSYVKDTGLYRVAAGEHEGDPDLSMVIQGPKWSVALIGYVLFDGKHLIGTGFYEGTPETNNNIERDREEEPDPKALAKWIGELVKDFEAQSTAGKVPGVRDGSGPPGGGPGLRKRQGQECPFMESEEDEAEAADEFPPGVADELAQRMKKHWRTSTYNPKNGTGLIKTGSWDLNLQQSGNEEKVWIDVKPTTRFRFFDVDDAVKFIDALERAAKFSG